LICWGARDPVTPLRFWDQRVELSREQREELRDLRAEVAKLHSVLSELQAERAKGFQFACEQKDAVADLPNFLPPRRVVN
jgi:hypothetical protein